MSERINERKTCPLCCGHGEVSVYVYTLFNRSTEFLKTAPLPGENGNHEHEHQSENNKKEAYTA